MVSTRRSSARLQEKTASAPSSPSTPSATQASPARTTRSATKATPPSASARQSARKSTPTKSTGSGAKRTRVRRSTGKAGSSESDEGVATESDSISEQQDAGSAADEPENDVKKQLFAEETTAPASSSATTTTTTSSTSATTTENVESEPESIEVVEEKAEVVAVQSTVVEEEEEEEIVMMADSDDEEEDEAATEPTAHKADEAEDEDDDDFDIAEYAKLAATGISLSTTSSAIGAQTTTATKPGYNLVPDTLDSGASTRVKFLEFEGSKLAQGAKVVADTAAVEEQKVLDHQLSKVAKANRQRQEAKNTDVSAGRKWFDMSTHEMDSDARRDFALLRMRNYLDPKKFYKTSDHTKKMPKHFQFGTVIEGAHEFKSARLSKKERKQTFTEEIMADDAIRKYTKRVFLQVQDSKAGHAKKKQKRR